MSDRIQISRDELFSESVEEGLARLRARRGDRPPEPPPPSPLRRVLYSGLFYLPVAAGLAALASWALLEPHIREMPTVAGEVLLVEDDPFVYEGARSLTVGDTQVLIGDDTVLEPGADGEEAFLSVYSIEEGEQIEAAGPYLGPGLLLGIAVRPTTPTRADAIGSRLEEPALWPLLLLFPLTAVMIAFALLAAEGVASRNWNRMLVRGSIGTLLALVFSALAMIPAGVFMFIGQRFLQGASTGEIMTVADLSGVSFMAFATCRMLAWACVGAGLGVGMNLVRSSRGQLRNSVLGGALGGAVGGLFFDPLDRFLSSGSLFGMEAGLSRFVGLLAVGLCIGFFVALVEQLARVAWIRVRTGPLAGKAFVLYQSPTTVGSSYQSDIYLFKDAEIDPDHARIHRVGNHYEIEDAGSRTGTLVNDQAVVRRRLGSGDQITIGGTVLEFEERAKKAPQPA